MDAVALNTVRKWEHRMYRWMDAYRGGLSARDAQIKVKAFSPLQNLAACAVRAVVYMLCEKKCCNTTARTPSRPHLKSPSTTTRFPVIGHRKRVNALV